MNIIAYFPFAIAIGLAIFALWFAFFAGVEEKPKKKAVSR